MGIASLNRTKRTVIRHATLSSSNCPETCEEIRRSTDGGTRMDGNGLHLTRSQATFSQAGTTDGSSNTATTCSKGDGRHADMSISESSAFLSYDMTYSHSSVATDKSHKAELHYVIMPEPWFCLPQGILPVPCPSHSPPPLKPRQPLACPSGYGCNLCIAQSPPSLI